MMWLREVYKKFSDKDGELCNTAHQYSAIVVHILLSENRAISTDTSSLVLVNWKDRLFVLYETQHKSLEKRT